MPTIFFVPFLDFFFLGRLLMVLVLVIVLGILSLNYRRGLSLQPSDGIEIGKSLGFLTNHFLRVGHVYRRCELGFRGFVKALSE